MEEEEVEEEVEEEEDDDDESDEAEGGSSSHHLKKPTAAAPAPRPALQRRYAVDVEHVQNHNTGVAIHHEPLPPPPAVAAPTILPPTITESRGKADGRPGEGSTAGGNHRPLQRSATLPANPQQRNVTVQLANKHRIVHFCNAVSR